MKFSLCKKWSMFVHLVCAFLLMACGDEEVADESTNEPSLLALQEAELLVIHHDAAGALIEYWSLESLPEEGVVQVQAIEGADEVHVTVLGKQRIPLLSRDFSVFSQKGGKTGETVEVIIERGKAVSFKSGGMKSPGLLTKKVLAEIDSDLAEGKKKSEPLETMRLMRDGG